VYSNQPTRISWMILAGDPARLEPDDHLSAGPFDELELQIILRRRIAAHPRDALKILKSMPGEPSVDLLAVWAHADLPGIIRWTESLDPRTTELAFTARGFLLSRVDAATQKRWLAEATALEDRGGLVRLVEHWAPWDPKAAWEFAVSRKDAPMCSDVVSAAVLGPWHHGAKNIWHFGIGVVKDFDVFSLPPAMREEVLAAWSQWVMEPWGEIDIGETARYGLDFMLRARHPPREGLLEFFSGRDVYPDDGDMVDRTFCALRVWAVTKPAEMEKWISTLEDKEMRKALTWLLEHPWGDGPPLEK
jgi:hypothetical protein